MYCHRPILKCSINLSIYRNQIVMEINTFYYKINWTEIFSNTNLVESLSTQVNFFWIYVFDMSNYPQTVQFSVIHNCISTECIILSQSIYGSVTVMSWCRARIEFSDLIKQTKNKNNERRNFPRIQFYLHKFNTRK